MRVPEAQTPLKGNALVTPLVLRVSMGGGNRLPSDDPSARLPAPYAHHKNGFELFSLCCVSNLTYNNKTHLLSRVWLKSSLVLAFLLGLTWTFGLLYLSEQTVAMAYAFTILNSLQGLVIFIFHCLQNDKV